MLPLDAFSPRFLWPYLPSLTKLFITFLCAVCTYSAYTFARILVGLAADKDGSTGKKGYPSSTIHRKLANLQNLLQFTFYLFGLCFLLQTPAAFVTANGNSGVALIRNIFQDLGIYIAYATDVFFVLLILHSIRWLIASVVDRAARGSDHLRANEPA
jgi:hypothetical protein